MKHIKRFLLISLLMVSLITFSSCSFITDFLNSVQSEAEKSKGETTKKEEPTKTDDTKPTTSNDETTSSSIESSTNIEPVLIDELDYGYTDLEGFDSNYLEYQSFYKDVKRLLNDFYLSTTNLTPTEVTIDGEKSDYHFIGDVSYFEYPNISTIIAMVIVKEVLLDYPEYYFVANEALTSSSTTDGVVTSKSVKLVCDEAFINGTTRQAFNTKIEEYLNNIRTQLDNKAIELEHELTNKEKVKLIHDYIVANAQYAYKEDGVTPDDSSLSHCMLGIIDKGKGVCESYTELFTYLLKKNNIAAITVTGKGYTSASATGENHAWNYVNIDGYWYAFDVTWDDTTNSYDYYGKSGKEFVNVEDNVIKDPTRGAHVARVSNKEDRLNYLYILPTLSLHDLSA